MMKHFKKISIIFCGLLFLFALAGCAEEAETEVPYSETSSVVFSYWAEKTEYQRGEEGELMAYMVNVSGGNYRYYGGYDSYEPSFQLYSPDDGVDISYRSPWVISDRPTYHIIKDGEMGSVTVYFTIPEDAPLGGYTLYLSYNEQNYTFEDVITVTE